jgi:anti-sigma factor RsiW
MIKNGSLKIAVPVDPKVAEEEAKIEKEVAELRRKMLPPSPEAAELRALRKRFE